MIDHHDIRGYPLNGPAEGQSQEDYDGILAIARAASLPVQLGLVAPSYSPGSYCLITLTPTGGA